MRNVLVALLVIQGVAAIAGGSFLVADPTGAKLGMEVGLLADSPFANFLVPGLWLLLVNGVGQVGAGVWAALGRSRAGLLAMLCGLLLMNWIAVQVAWVGLIHWLQPAVFAVGLAEVGLGSRLHAAKG